MGSLGKSGVKEIASYLDSKDNDVSGRHACLELCYALFLLLGNDQNKLLKLMGDMSEKSVAMIEERIRQKLKGAASANAPIPSLVKQQHQQQQPQITGLGTLPTPPPIVATSNESESNILLPPAPPSTAATAATTGNNINSNNNNNAPSVNENKAPMVSYTPRKTPSKNKKMRF